MPASYPYKMKVQDMTQRYRKFQRAWGMWYAFDNATGNSVSLKTRVKAEAVQKINAMNEAERQPGISLGLARVYLNATDPKLAARTWQDVMNDIVAKKRTKPAGAGRLPLRIRISPRSWHCVSAKPVRSISTGSWLMARCPRMFTSGGYTITPWAWNGC